VVSVREGGTLGLSATKAFVIVVAPPPLFTSINQTEAGLELGWRAIPGNNYRLEVTRDLSSWTEAATGLVPFGEDAVWTISNLNDDRGFYRLVDMAVPHEPFFPCTTTITNTPNWTCCETNIHFPKTLNFGNNGNATKSGTTGTYDSNTKRSVEVSLTLPVLFECKNVANQKCVADIAVEVKATPQQLDTASNKYSVKPHDQKVETKLNSASPDCDNKPHSTTVTITWTGYYPGTDPVKGTLVLDLTVRVDKGTIKHTFGIPIKSASGSSASLGDPYWEPKK
jgi:hypothetical protein